MDIGARLRQAREARGLTIEALSKSTRVQPKTLSAIERNDAVSLPPRPYGRGFVRAYASEVGLDPDGTVRDFFSQFAVVVETDAQATPQQEVEGPTPPGRRWLWPLAAAVGYVLVGAIVILTGQWAFQRGGESGAVGTTGALPAAAAAAPERQPAPPQAPPVTAVVVALEAHGPAWVAASVDGRRTVYRTLQAGDRVSLKGTREVIVRTGDAGAVTWQVNGRDAGRMGVSGEVRTARVTPENAAQVK